MKVDNDIYQCAVNFPYRSYFFKGSQPIKQPGIQVVGTSIIKRSSGTRHQYYTSGNIFALPPHLDLTLSTIIASENISQGNNSLYYAPADPGGSYRLYDFWQYIGHGEIRFGSAESVSSYLYHHPLSFKTSASFTITNGVKTQPASPTFWDSVINTERDRIVGTFPSLFGPSTVSVSILTPTSGKLIEYKLLNYADYLTVLNSSVAEHTVSFYNNLNSPTLSDAILSGGCQYFGVIQIKRKIAESLRFGYNNNGGSPFLEILVGIFDGSENSYSPVYSPLESDDWPHRASNNYSMHLSQ